MPNCKSCLVTEAEKKHVRRRTRFQNIETRGVKNYFFLQGMVPKEIQAILTETLGEVHHRMPPSSFNVLIFPHVLCLILEDTKQ